MPRDRRAPALLPVPAGQDRPAGRAGPARSAGRGCTGRAGGGRGTTQAAEVDGAGPGPLCGLLGFSRPAPDRHRGVRCPGQPALPDPRAGQLPLVRVGRGLLRAAVRGRRRGVRRHPDRPAALGPGPTLPVLRVAPRRGVVHAVHDCHRRVDPAGLPGRRHQRPAGQHDRQHAVPAGGVRVAVVRGPARAARRGGQRDPRDGPAAAVPGCAARLHHLRDLQQAPAHLPVHPQRRVRPPPASARRAIAGLLRRPAGRLRGPGRGRPHGGREGRGLHLEGPARLRHVHRVRPLPEPVPGVEHRQAALAQAAHHEPARPRVGQGSLPAGNPGPRRRAGRHTRSGARGGAAPARRPGGRRDGGRRRARRERPGRRAVRHAVVVHHLRGVRGAVPGRHRARRPHRRPAPPPGAHGVRVPRGGRHHAAQPRARRRPLGPRGSGAPGVGRAAGLPGARARGRGRGPHPR